MNKTLILLIIATTFLSQASSRFVLKEIRVRESAQNFLKFLEGFTKGFIDEDISDIEHCAFDSTDVVKEFTDVIQKFRDRSRDSIVSGYQEILLIV